MKKRNGIIPMNCVDRALLAYENTNQVMIIHMILSIEGDIDADRLNQALISVLHLHPTMRTIMRSRHFRHFRQIQEDFKGKILEVSDLVDLQSVKDLSNVEINTVYERCLSEWINRPLDIEAEFPFRVLLLRKTAAEFSLIFTFHHSAVDEIRAIRFINEVISRYNNKTPDESLLPEDMRIHHKGDELVELARSERSKTKHFYREMLSHLLYFLFIAPYYRPSRIFHDKLEHSEEIRFCSGKINPTELEQIESKSKSVSGTVNDILLAACFRTIEKWNRLHGEESKKISIMIPVDIGPEELQHIVSNQLSYISLSTVPKDRTDPTKLLRRVRTKTAYIIKQSRGKTFFSVYLAYFFSHLPLAIHKPIAQFISLPLYADTVTLSNVGFIRLGDDGEGEMEKGGFKILDFAFVGPVLTIMGMFLSAGTYNNNLSIDLSYKTSRFSKEKAGEFLDLYLEEIKNYQVDPEAG